MLSTKSGRIYILVPLVLFVLFWYYLDLTSSTVLLHNEKAQNPHTWQSVVEPSRDLATAGTATAGAADQNNSTPLTPTTFSVELPPSHTTSSVSTPSLQPTLAVETAATSSQHVLSPSDVLLIFKTGASTIWRRMPLHLTTTLADGRVPNNVIYSDLQEQLARNIESVNVLENDTKVIQEYDSSAFDSYLDLQSPFHAQTYREHARLPGDEPASKPGNTPGWRLDKWKFIPMLTHAWREYPNLEYYIYIEDDTWLFLDNLLHWLSNKSPDEDPFYYGAIAGESNVTFAQGGSGLVFSRSLMRSVFGGDNPPNLKQYGNHTSQSCCGDVAFGKVLRDHGIYVNKGEFGPVSFRSEPPWKTGFEERMWCTPVFTFHHLHQSDIAQLAEIERMQRESSDPSRPTIFRDIFTALILPHLGNDTRNNWDNFASRYTLTANSTSGFHPTFRPLNSTAFAAAFKSPVACQAACLSFDECFSWRHETATATCAMESAINLGREVDPQAAWETETEIVSGWMLDRMKERLLNDTCDVVREP